MKKIVSLTLAAGLLAFSFSGCVKRPEPVPCTYDSCLAVAPQAEVQQVENYLSANGITATKHCSGLYYKIENAGTGTTPEFCGDVEAKYKGYLTDGNVFDQTATPIPFNLMGVIRGWTNGVPLVKEGGRILLFIPPSLGYGNQEVRDRNTGALRIPANSVLIFEVDLTTVY